MALDNVKGMESWGVSLNLFGRAGTPQRGTEPLQCWADPPPPLAMVRKVIESEEMSEFIRILMVPRALFTLSPQSIWKSCTIAEESRFARW